MEHMKMPITWHENNLKNRRSSLQRKTEELQRLQASIDASEKELVELEAQIVYAKRLGKDGFDEEKFMKKSKA
jgi:uncharacterized protein (DUF3084 family)